MYVGFFGFYADPHTFIVGPTLHPTIDIRVPIWMSKKYKYRKRFPRNQQTITCNILCNNVKELTANLGLASRLLLTTHHIYC